MVKKIDVILMGEDHHNGLGLVRSFGVNNVRPYGIIICPKNGRSFVAQSRYWRKVYIAHSEEDAIKILCKNFGTEEVKPVIMTWSDNMAACLDGQYDELQEKFILPSIAGKGGKILELMDKQKQVEFAKKYGLSMLPSEIAVSTIEDIKCKADKVGYPCIMKPVASVEGEKKDIRICNNKEEISYVAKEISKKKYKRILVQKYLASRTEYVLTGAIDTTVNVFTVVSHIRQWPVEMGSGSFSYFATDDKSLQYGKKCMLALRKAGYSGNVDIEYFCDDDVFYLNEINWRSSGRNFVSLYTNVYPAVAYYNGIVKGEKREEYSIKDGYTMNEATDFRHVLARNISLWRWLNDMWRTDSFAIWYWRDPLPACIHYVHLTKELCRRMMGRIFMV